MIRVCIIQLLSLISRILVEVLIVVHSLVIHLPHFHLLYILICLIHILIWLYLLLTLIHRIQIIQKWILHMLLLSYMLDIIWLISLIHVDLLEIWVWLHLEVIAVYVWIREIMLMSLI